MFRKLVVISAILSFSGQLFITLPKTSYAITPTQQIIELQTKIILLKIEILKLELAKALEAERLISVPVRPNSEQINGNLRKSVVNILCQNQGQSPFGSISGSGVIIDTRGIILTNAHIGQYFLIRDYPTAGSIKCTIRTGSPARPAYEAKLIYLPPAWVQNNSKAITTRGATGTGEDDYAMLAITATATAEPLPGSFPAISVDENVDILAEDYPVLLASYPGELVGSIIIQKSLEMISAITKIERGFYFESNTNQGLDLLDVSGTVVSQAGSSGGAVVSLDSARLIGIIVTSTTAVDTSNRQLLAITLAHINRSIQKNLGRSLTSFLSQPISLSLNDFEQNVAPGERSKLIQR